MATLIQGSYLRLFIHEDRRHHGQLLYEWLLEHAKTMGVPRGMVFRAIADFGRSKVIHEQHFFELAGDISVRVDFLLTADELTDLLQLLEAEKLQIPYAVFTVEFGSTAGDH